MSSEPPRVLSREEVLRRMDEQRARLPFYAMFSSYLGGIVTDPALMTIPIDDHMCHRGHAVFDTTGVDHGQLYCSSRHIDRLLRSAANAKIKHSFTKEWILSTVVATASAAGQPFAAVRMWISAGAGDFGIAPPGDALFYCVVSNYFPMSKEPLSEVTISSTSVGMKTHPLATTKSVCYLPNVLLHLTAKERGGTYGIWVDESTGFVKEGPINTLVVVNGTRLCSPPPVDVLPSCSVLRVFEIAPLLGATDCSFRNISVQELYDADEVFFVGGDTHFFSIRQIDGVIIGRYKFRTQDPLMMDKIAELIDSEVRSGSFDSVPLHFSTDLKQHS